MTDDTLDLDELMARDPTDLSKQDIDAIIAPRVKWMLEKATKEGDCLICHYAPSKVGYPKCDKYTYAHRYICEAFQGPIPGGKFVMHSCDNKRCINPEHLSIGTPHDNVWDMIRKKRYGKTGGCKPRYFTEQQYREMQRLESEGWSQRKIATKFNSNQTTIWKYLKGTYYEDQNV